MTRRYSENLRAFTLLELVVVMAIVVIATATVLPVVSKARGRSQEVFCQSNLRILSTGLRQYTMDNAERYPFGFAFNRFNPASGRPSGSDSRYITWFSSIDKYLTSGTDELISLDANSGFFDGATTRNFHAAFKCPSVSSNFQQQIHYYQHAVVMPHLTLELPAAFRAPGMPAIKAAKVNQLYSNTALIWDTQLSAGATPVTPSMFWSTDHTVAGFAPFASFIDDNAGSSFAENGLLIHPELTERRFRSPGADRFAASANPLKNPAGPIAYLSDQAIQSISGSGAVSQNADSSGGIVFNAGMPGSVTLGLVAMSSSPTAASARSTFVRSAKSPMVRPGTASAMYIDSISEETC